MLPSKTVARVALLVVVVYGALAIAPRVWPAWERGYAHLFRSGGNALFSRFWFWPEARVRFLDLRSATLAGEIGAATGGTLPADFIPPKPTRDQDTLLVLTNRAARGSVGMLRTGSRMMGYVPAAVLLALIAATPLPWSRRGWALAWGLFLVHVLIAARLTALVAHSGFAAPGKAYALFDPGPLARSVLARVDEVLADNPTFAYVAPVLLWMLILLSLEVWATWRGRRTVASK